ncbi:hypothetical protein E1B28_012671 [Marasmius oreades]|uniref:Uncharacterized protein n=1 Tax=Marasmius oreades TaxID=181124 RepID=A0A9P7RT14_9AGAR|nr:uncharacterized protein E1B28_012671 [Marasmius oreades]KAG7088701.1 hypothetical protein E1B28_012671 [Marasmius oreades]
MYIIMRYGNIVEQGITLAFYLWRGPPISFCKIWFYIDEWVAYGLFIPTTVFLGLRTYALYRGQAAPLFYKWLITSLVVGCNIVMFTSLGLATRDIRFVNAFPIPDLPCSFSFESAPYTAGLIQFAGSMILDVSLFLLTSYRAITYFKEGNRRITSVILRDGLIYTAVLSCTNIMTLVLYTSVTPTLRSLLVAPSKSLSVIITSRIVLNLRKIILKPNVTLGNLSRQTDLNINLDGRSLEPMAFGERISQPMEEY